MDGTEQNDAVALHNDNVCLTFTHVTARGDAYSYGVYNEDTSLLMDNVTITALGGSVGNIGVNNRDASSSTFRRSVLEANSRSVSINFGASTVKVINSQLISTVASGVACFHSYDEDLNDA